MFSLLLKSRISSIDHQCSIALPFVSLSRRSNGINLCCRLFLSYHAHTKGSHSSSSSSSSSGIIFAATITYPLPLIVCHHFCIVGTLSSFFSAFFLLHPPLRHFLIILLVAGFFLASCSHYTFFPPAHSLVLSFSLSHSQLHPLLL